MNEKHTHDEPENVLQAKGQQGRSVQLSRRKFLTLMGGTGAAVAASSVLVAKPTSASAEVVELSVSSAPTDLISMSATKIAKLIRSKRVSSVEVVQAYLDHIDAVNPQLKAVVQNRGDAALADAQAADAMLARGRSEKPLHGVPITITDSIEVAGVISSAGTYGRRAFIPAQDATAVARLKAAGAIVLGLTNVPELSQGIGSDNVLYGRTNNPYDFTRNPGGNSGGEAAIIAAGGSPFGLGVDPGGGLRIPAHFCGIAGLKPTSGRASRTGHFPAVGGAPEKLTQFGPMSRFVEDLFLGLKLIAGGDPGDSNIYPVPLQDPRKVRLDKLRIGFFTNNGLGGLAEPTAETVDTVEAAAAALQMTRAEVTEVVPPMRDPLAQQSLRTIFLNLAWGDGGKGLAAFLDAIGTPPDKRSPFMQQVLQVVAPLAIPTDEYQLALFLWDTYRGAMLAFMENYDALICPVMPVPALPHPNVAATTIEQSARYSYAYWSNMLGWPSAVIRGGTSPEGLPIGVQMVAKPWREDVALAIASYLEEVLGGWQPSPLLP